MSSPEVAPISQNSRSHTKYTHRIVQVFIIKFSYIRANKFKLSH